MLRAVNIHRSYSLAQLAVLDLAASIGFKGVRVDIYDASPETCAYLSALNVSCAARGLHVLPVIVPSAAASQTEVKAKAWGAQTGMTLATQFPNMHWEAGNELDMYCGIPGNDGTQPNHYDTTKYLQCRGAIKGLYEGLKSASSSTVAVGCAGLHYGFLRRLANDGVVWDITTEHYYAVPMAPDIKAGAEKLFAEFAKFGKPIAMTEFNQQNGHLSTNNANAVIGMIDAMESMATKYNIIAHYIYELLDEPGLPGGEAVYGMANSSGVLNALGKAVKARFTT